MVKESFQALLSIYPELIEDLSPQRAEHVNAASEMRAFIYGFRVTLYNVQVICMDCSGDASCGARGVPTPDDEECTEEYGGRNREPEGAFSMSHSGLSDAFSGLANCDHYSLRRTRVH